MNIQNEVSKQLKLWNFEIVESLYEENISALEADYVNFLLDIGKFDKLYDFCLKINSRPSWWKFTYYKNLDFDVFKNNLSLAINLNFKDCMLNKKHIACYILNLEISNLRLESNFCLTLFRDYLVCIGKNDYKWEFYAKLSEYISTAYFIKKSLDYFFYLKDTNFINYMQDYLYILQVFIEKDFYGAKICYDKICHLLKQENLKTSNSYNIAVLVTGSIRGVAWRESLLNLKEKVINPLKADCFLFSWDNITLWQGIQNRGNWLYRRCINFHQFAPLEIKDINKFKQFFPYVYEKLDKNFYKNFNDDDLNFIQNYFNDVFLDNEKRFILKYNPLGILNNLHKMLYGRKMAFELMQKYEKKNSKKYDFVLIVRPDVDYFPMDLKLIENLKQNEAIGTHEIYPHHKEVLDYLFIGSNILVEKICNIWEALQDEKISFFKDCFHANFHAQEALQKWIMYNDIRLIKPHLAYCVNIARSISSQSIVLPNITQELNQDISNLEAKNVLDQTTIQQCLEFFTMLQNSYKIADDDLCNDLSMFYSAKFRIKNHLSYKLGEAMILNSKNLKGFLKMPYILNQISKQHKIELEKHHNKINNFSFINYPKIEECLDYQEALNIKNSLTYKLGENLIRASKQRLGYIKFFVNVYKLIKEHNSRSKLQ